MRRAARSCGPVDQGPLRSRSSQGQLAAVVKDLDASEGGMVGTVRQACGSGGGALRIEVRLGLRGCSVDEGLKV